MKLTLARSLAEIKLLNSKIEKNINNLQLVATKTGKKDVINNSNLKVVDFNKNAKSSYQSTLDLIKRRNLIKSKLTQANAITTVFIGDKSYTIAEAIDRKNSINIEKDLLNRLTSTLNQQIKTMNIANDKMEDNINKMVETKMGTDKSKSEDIADLKRIFREADNTTLVDPLDLKTKIEELTKTIEEFELNIDFALSEANAINYIEIED
jgi:hypothetical protein